MSDPVAALRRTRRAVRFAWLAFVLSSLLSAAHGLLSLLAAAAVIAASHAVGVRGGRDVAVAVLHAAAHLYYRALLLPASALWAMAVLTSLVGVLLPEGASWEGNVADGTRCPPARRPRASRSFREWRPTSLLQDVKPPGSGGNRRRSVSIARARPAAQTARLPGIQSAAANRWSEFKRSVGDSELVTETGLIWPHASGVADTLNAGNSADTSGRDVQHVSSLESAAQTTQTYAHRTYSGTHSAVGSLDLRYLGQPCIIHRPAARYQRSHTTPANADDVPSSANLQPLQTMPFGAAHHALASAGRAVSGALAGAAASGTGFASSLNLTSHFHWMHVIFDAAQDMYRWGSIPLRRFPQGPNTNLASAPADEQKALVCALQPAGTQGCVDGGNVVTSALNHAAMHNAVSTTETVSGENTTREDKGDACGEFDMRSNVVAREHRRQGRLHSL